MSPCLGFKVKTGRTQGLVSSKGPFGHSSSQVDQCPACLPKPVVGVRSHASV